MPVRALVAIDIHALNIGTESALFPLSWENYLMCFDLTDWQPRIASSVHEAAHAIVADRLGVPVDVVLISVDGNGGGETRAPSTDVRHEIQIALAGGIAEYRYCDAVGYPEDKGRHPYWGQLSDKERLFKAARLALNDDAVAARNLVEELRPMVVAMIDREWDAIMAMAVTLEYYGNLSGGILAGALGGKGDIGPPGPRDAQ
jgi:hypothetical protein